MKKFVEFTRHIVVPGEEDIRKPLSIQIKRIDSFSPVTKEWGVEAFIGNTEIMLRGGKHYIVTEDYRTITRRINATIEN